MRRTPRPDRRLATAVLLAALGLLAAPSRAGDAPGPAGDAAKPAAPPPPVREERRLEVAQEAPEPGWRWDLFSDAGRAFPALLADPREAQIRLGYLQDTQRHESVFDLGFGGDLGVLRASDGDRDLTLTARGLIAPRFQFFSQSFNLINTDFLGGPALGFRRGPTAVELFPYHQSSHLGDDELVREGRPYSNYSYEAGRLLLSQMVARGLRLYGGPAVKVRGDPEELRGKVTLQAGAEGRILVLGLPAFAAVDVQSKEEADWQVSTCVQVGFELGNPERIVKRQRVFVEFYSGSSYLGQFYKESETHIMVGGGFNF
jgi:hypothetical protein